MAGIGHDTDERRRNAIALLDADLHGLLQVKEVEDVLQAKLSVARVRSMSRMSTVADDRPGMRRFCVDVLGLEEARDVVEIASLVDHGNRRARALQSETRLKQRQGWPACHAP